jgi:hypothetical protein
MAGVYNADTPAERQLMHDMQVRCFGACKGIPPPRDQHGVEVGKWVKMLDHWDDHNDPCAVKCDLFSNHSQTGEMSTFYKNFFAEKHSDWISWRSKEQVEIKDPAEAMWNNMPYMFGATALGIIAYAIVPAIKK